MPTACHEAAKPGGFDLSSALRALADAGLAPDVLAAAVEALMRSQRPPLPAVGPRIVRGA